MSNTELTYDTDSEKEFNRAVEEINTDPMLMYGDCRSFRTVCCDFKFVGMNHSPERNGVCRHCNGQWKGVTSE